MTRMPRRPTTTAAVTSVLAASGLILPPAPASAQEDPPGEILLTGVVRDFRERTVEGGHPDFERQPEHGFGHYVGNVAQQLDADGKPAFTGDGFLVFEQWSDASGQPIAPHLANAAYSCTAAEAPEFDPMSTVLEDSRGDDAFEVSFVSVSYDAGGTSTWTYHVRELEGGKDLSHWNLRLEASHVVAAGTTAGYDFGEDGSTGFFGIKWDVADGFDEGEFVIVLDGHFDAAVHEEGALAKGGRRSDRGPMLVPTTDTVSAGGELVCQLEADPSHGDQEGEAGYSDPGGIDSPASFSQWFRDVPGVNLSEPLTLTLVRQEDGTYVFDDRDDPQYLGQGGFFPIDGRLFGNPGGEPDHNFHFTLELHTQFTYRAGSGQMFSFAGDDDVWVFIDGKLGIDLGGVHGRTEQVVDLDRFGLEDGQAYPLDFFFAERHRTESNFRITTNLVLDTGPVSTITAAFD